MRDKYIFCTRHLYINEALVASHSYTFVSLLGNAEIWTVFFNR